MMKVAKYVKERDEALFSLDEKKIKKFCKKYRIAIPEKEEVFWAGVYRSILGIPYAPEELKVLARLWLDNHGYKRTILL